MNLEAHPAAAIFPLMEGAEFAALVADIRAHGLRDPIILTDGLVLDGRNRLRACDEAGIEPHIVEWDGAGRPETFVVSKNLHRRHLNESQRAMVAARLANLKDGRPWHKEITGTIGPVTHSNAEAAALLNVSVGSVKRAKAVLRDGTAEEIQAVETGQAAVASVAKHMRGRREEVAPPKPMPAPAQSKSVATGVPTDIRGRRMPSSPTHECMERVIDQINNTLVTLDHLLNRPDAEDHPELPTWTAALERSRTALTRLINRCRERKPA